MLWVKATFLATSLAPATSWPLLNPEGWEAGGGGDKPSQVACYCAIYRLSHILEKKPVLKLTVLQSKTSGAPRSCAGGCRRLPGREVGEAKLPLSLSEHGQGDMTFVGVPSWFLSSSNSRLCCRRRKSADLVPQAQMGRSKSLQLMMNLPHPLGTG